MRFLKRICSGAGIGLELIKQIIEAHAGRNRADSQVGQVAAFYFRLPLFEFILQRRETCVEDLHLRLILQN